VSTPLRQHLARVDRRLIFLAIGLAVVLPLVFHLTLAVHPTPIVSRIFDKIESLPPGSRVLFSFDYGPSTVPENQPMAEATLRHALAKECRVYLMTIWETGPPQIVRAIDEVVKKDFPERAHGKDYIYLGFKAGQQGAINALLADFKGLFTTDANGAEINSFEIMEGIGSLRDFDLIVAIGSGLPGVKEWVQFGGDPGDVPVAAGVTAVEAPLLYPYYPRQLLGLMGGLQGAAEYEAALVAKYPQYRAQSSQATLMMGPQTVAHVVIILFIVLGNVSYFLERRARKREGR
jgi:hypothetical protein